MPQAKPLAQFADIAEALALLTRLPVSAPLRRGAAAAWAWPLAGLAPGGVAALIAGLAGALTLPPSLTAGLALAALTLATGALHDDGLADFADGAWGGATREKRLTIMRDSRLGSYGALALGLSLLLRWGALTTLAGAHWLTAPLLATALLSRAPMAVLAALLPHARSDGLSHGVGRPSRATALLAVAIALAGAFVLLGWAALAPVLWVSLACIALAWIADKRLGGQTGDVLGAAQQLAEIAALIALATLAT